MSKDKKNTMTQYRRVGDHYYKQIQVVGSGPKWLRWPAEQIMKDHGKDLLTRIQPEQHG